MLTQKKPAGFLLPALELIDRLFAELDHYRYDQERDDVNDLDHRVDGRTGSILVRIADSVACY
jgi:hypothetical protein